MSDESANFLNSKSNTVRDTTNARPAIILTTPGLDALNRPCVVVGVCSVDTPDVVAFIAGYCPTRARALAADLLKAANEAQTLAESHTEGSH